jgi:hypothetical protein
MILATALLVCGCLLACEAQMEMEVEPALADMAQVDMANTLGCHRRLYRYKVTQSDSAGRSCWDNVNVMSCWGRCDSNEVRSKSHFLPQIFGQKCVFRALSHYFRC